MGSSANLSISVVIATYNGAAHLQEQLSSIAEQSRLPTQVVISDDASTDGSDEIAREFASQAPFSVDLVNNDKPSGAWDNFMGALPLASGDLIAFCDQDDVWYKDKLERCASAFSDPNVAMVVHASRRIHFDGALVIDKGFHTGILAGALNASPLAMPAGSHSMFRRGIANLVPPADRPISIYGDPRQTHDEWSHYAARVYGRVVYDKTKLMDYRRHEEEQTFHYENARPAALLGIDHEDYVQIYNPRKRAAAATARAVHLASLESATPYEQARLRPWIACYERLARAENRRVAIRTAPGKASAASKLVAAAATGAYRSQSRGGCGPLAAVRDGFRLVGR